MQSRLAGPISEKLFRQKTAAVAKKDTYRYTIRDSQGNVVDGEMHAYCLREAIRKLQKKSFSIISLGKVPDKVELMAGRWSRNELMTLVRSLSIMSKSGLGIVRSLMILESQAEDKRLKELLGHFKRIIEKGYSFSDAMSLYPRVFPRFHLSIVRAGERGGFFDRSIDYVAELIEKEMSLKKQLNTAITYPTAVFFVGLAVCVFAFYWILPIFSGLVKDLGIKLPFCTQLILSAGDLLGRFYILIPLLIGAMFLAVRLVRYLLGSKRGREWWDRMVLTLPLIRDIKKKSVLTHAALVLAALIRSGEHLVGGLELTADICDNIYLANAFQDVADRIKDGNTLGDSMKRHADLFPATLIAMVAVGEESGDLDGVLSKTAHLYEIELMTFIEGFLKLVEPLVIGMLGIIVSILMLALFVPVYTALNKF